MTAATVEELRRRWFSSDTPDLTAAERDLLQSWHDEQGHNSDPFNGCCFCCCEACDPR